MSKGKERPLTGEEEEIIEALRSVAESDPAPPRDLRHGRIVFLTRAQELREQEAHEATKPQNLWQEFLDRFRRRA